MGGGSGNMAFSSISLKLLKCPQCMSQLELQRKYKGLTLGTQYLDEGLIVQFRTIFNKRQIQIATSLELWGLQS